MKKYLVAYFSASGTTAKVAKKLAAALQSDIYEIRPAVTYSSADLDWTDPKSRSSIEMKNKTYRPTLYETKDVSCYDAVFVGFPIWWYVAPTLINTFLESCDLKGKTVIPFATSGGSGMGNTTAELIPSCNGSTVKEGRRFSQNVSEKELSEWAEKMM